VIVESNFTWAVKFCQAECQRDKLPFWFVNELMLAATDDPARLKLACNIARKGQYIADVRRVLTTY
jgi:hypothetical protein